MDSDDAHFVSKKYLATFKLKEEVGPFNAITTISKEIEESMLKDLNMEHEEKWHYDPHHIISQKRILSGFIPYTHQSDPKIEKVENMDTWEQVCQLKQKKVHISNNIIEIPQR